MMSDGDGDDDNITMTTTMTYYIITMTATTDTSPRHLRDHAIGQQTKSVLSSVRQHQLVHIVRAKKQALLGDVIEVTFIILCEANDASCNPMRQITHSHSSSEFYKTQAVSTTKIQKYPKIMQGEKSTAARGLSTVPRPHNNSTKQTAMLQVSSVMTILPRLD